MTREELIADLHCGTQIADDAAKHGYIPELLGTNGKTDGDMLKLWDCGNGVRAIETNGDTVWDESDPDAFAELLAQIETA